MNLVARLNKNSYTKGQWLQFTIVVRKCCLEKGWGQKSDITFVKRYEIS